MKTAEKQAKLSPGQSTPRAHVGPGNLEVKRNQNGQWAKRKKIEISKSVDDLKMLSELEEVFNKKRCQYGDGLKKVSTHEIRLKKIKPLVGCPFYSDQVRSWLR